MRKRRISFTRRRRELEKEKCFITRTEYGERGGEGGRGWKDFLRRVLSASGESLALFRGEVKSWLGEPSRGRCRLIPDKRCTIPPIRDRTLIASVSSLLIIHALKYLRISSSFAVSSFFLSLYRGRVVRERYSSREERTIFFPVSDRPTTKVDVPRARPDSPPLSLSFPVYEFWCSFSRLSTPMENDPIPVSSRPPDRIVAPEGKNPSVGSPSSSPFFSPSLLDPQIFRRSSIYFESMYI